MATRPPPRFDWTTAAFETYVKQNVIPSKSARWNFDKLPRVGKFRIAAINQWVLEDPRYTHTRVTIACAILPFIKGSSKLSLARLERLKYRIISDELKRKREQTENIF